ncbi:hypothetical protein [Chryseobacterium luquanense]|uniref:Lipoprotein n=1 Tax=Chryseobacterium luquanense TaxID=2983766 RepID=A0ABT3Y8Y4_9FLAO|nr:hypothetical protein [Chryseobacterium luquanense]MCX8534641.1 hypothetical protein [Chryseobacterium luquanense]
MKLRFIQILILIVTLNSCRELDEIAEIEEYSNQIMSDNVETNLKKENYQNLATRKDSASNSGFEIDNNDPPVKHGGHWRTTN